MASPTAPPLPFSPVLKDQSQSSSHLSRNWLVRKPIPGTNHRLRRRNNVAATAAGGPRSGQRAPPGVDTRIHWENEDEGWVGGSTNSTPVEEQLKAEQSKKFADLLNSSSDSHYQFLGVSAEADMEEIKAAYRRLSKEYHPDTTTLPIKAASEKFMKLKEIYEVLSNDEKRRFYDWTLAQEAASREAIKLRKKLEDPRMQDVANWEPVPDMVDRLGGKNLELSDQAKTALTFDIFAILVSVCCIIYAIFFKEY
ncbi:OLC1v1004227C1 [Oldenlandia corymbosa var. corymbosa]|uniref:OLC1v1004227C1 n=1 Tax=Oldenlandia corymbosa var. corymbosa TaxID=529605 RepID=A0AAV1DE88_OLDCO|nr:OLC1v1004227C1 [Oldenlandia corymbosa var. corymbosa]